MKKSKNKGEPKTTIHGLPEKWKHIYIAHLFYSATCEGVTVESHIVHDEEYFEEKEKAENWNMLDQFESKWPKDFFKLIPAVIEKEAMGQKFFDWNDEFKIVFYESFGFENWSYFNNCISRGGFFQLETKMHYNLS